jgi:putative hydrolase of the HAD superfamily
MTSVNSVISTKKAVVFDLFHTLTGFESSWGQLPTTSEFLGLSQEKWNEQVFDKSKERLTGKIKDPVTIVKTMAHAINPSIPMEKIIASVKNRMLRFETALINIPKESVDTIIELKKRGKKIGLSSNADFTEMAGWSKSPLANLFDSIVFSCEVGYMKPEPQMYQISLQQLAVDAEDAVFVGDGSSNELEGARAAGMTTIMTAGIIRRLWPEQIDGRRKWANHVIENIDELIQ